MRDKLLNYTWEEEESAYIVTQFLSGTLTLTVDALLRKDFTSEEEEVIAHCFIKDFMKFVARWLKWLVHNPETVRRSRQLAERNGSERSALPGGQKSSHCTLLHWVD